MSLTGKENSNTIINNLTFLLAYFTVCRHGSFFYSVLPSKNSEVVIISLILQINKLRLSVVAKQGNEEANRILTNVYDSKGLLWKNSLAYILRHNNFNNGPYKKNI